MGYKLAGYDVIGCNEIDPRMNKVYVENHHPKYNYLEPIQEFKLRKDLPEELYQLDILDGSPPCSSFSMAGVRGEDWGKEKKFREGQASQVLDTLFFDFIDLAKELQPKVVVAENVKGLVLGDAKKYVQKIYKELDEAGYYVSHFLMDGQNMGIPQRRERVFFVCLRKDLAGQFLEYEDMFTMKPKIDMNIKEPMVTYGEFMDEDGREFNGKMRELWELRKDGDIDMSGASMRKYNKKSFFNQNYIYSDKPTPTLTGHYDSIIPFDKPKYTSNQEVCCISSFPQDYNFLDEKPHYICGMSVPPVMMAQVASRIHEQWLSKISKS